ncbi:MAG: transporter substrate-binding domain-containing protein [Candidatus Sedimenticola sp. (ex Thyasira tokunagai)]
MGNQVKVNGIQDLNNYQIGVVLKDIGEQLLLEKGVNKRNIQSISGKNVIDLSFKKMENNRIDLFAYELNVIKYGAKIHGYDPDKYEAVYTLKEGELYYAFNKNTDDKIIQKWQQALDDLKTDGGYQKILNSY